MRKNNALPTIPSWCRVMMRSASTRLLIPLCITVVFLFVGCAQQVPPQADKSQAGLPPVTEQKVTEKEVVDHEQYVGGTIGVFNFENNTPGVGDRMEFLSTWFSTRISETLSEQPAVTVVERNEIKSILKELDLGTGDLANRDTALQLGRLIAADFFVFGNYFILQEQLYCTTRLVDARSGVIIKSDEVLSHVDDMSQVVEDISGRILLGLGKSIQTKSGSKETPEIAKLYVEGIQAMDNGDLDKALTLFQEVLARDSGNRWAKLRIKEILSK